VDVIKSVTLSTEELIERLSKVPAVEYVEPNYYVELVLTPNDPSFSIQWGLTKIRSPQAWDLTTGNDTLVAVVDTGVQLNHPDLQGRVIAGATFVPGTSTPNDDHGHGTHVAGTVAAATNNGLGVAGAGFNTRILAVKVLDSFGNGTVDQVANGITYAANNGAKVINLSLGGDSPSTTLRNAVVYSWNLGVLNVAAAGNDGSSSIVIYPAGYTDVVLPVGATTQSDTRAWFSNFGSWIRLYAPGLDIFSTCLGSTFCNNSGTSMACPHVSGVAALVYARFATQSPTNAKVRKQIKCTAAPVTIEGVTRVRVDAYDAVRRTCRGDCQAEYSACNNWCERYQSSPSKYLQCVDGCNEDYEYCNTQCNTGHGCSPF
jgi:thermitase